VITSFRVIRVWTNSRSGWYNVFMLILNLVTH